MFPNYNKYSKLNFTQKIEEPLSTRSDNPFDYLWNKTLQNNCKHKTHVFISIQYQKPTIHNL